MEAYSVDKVAIIIWRSSSVAARSTGGGVLGRERGCTEDMIFDVVV